MTYFSIVRLPPAAIGCRRVNAGSYAARAYRNRGDTPTPTPFNSAPPLRVLNSLFGRRALKEEVRRALFQTTAAKGGQLTVQSTRAAGGGGRRRVIRRAGLAEVRGHSDRREPGIDQVLRG